MALAIQPHDPNRRAPSPEDAPATLSYRVAYERILEVLETRDPEWTTDSMVAETILERLGVRP